MTLHLLTLSNYDVDDSWQPGTFVGWLGNYQNANCVRLINDGYGMFKHHGVALLVGDTRLDGIGFPNVTICFEEYDPTNPAMRYQSYMGLNVGSVRASGIAAPVATALPLKQFISIGQDPSLTIADEVESVAATFEKAIKRKPESAKNVVIPKTCIALYSEEHAQASVMHVKKVQIMDAGERLATHVCPPDDRHAYQELYPDAVVLGICIMGSV